MFHTPFDPPRPSSVYIPEDVDPNSPIELFKLFFDAEIVDYICNTSNEYAESEKEKRPAMYRYYKSMTKNDLYKLLGVIIHLGYRRIPRYRLAWSPSSLCFDPFLNEVMSRNHFESMSFLHVVDKEREDQLKNDKLAKVRPLIDHINKKCQQLYQPYREVSIDERMVCSKARFSFKQYIIRNKPTKWGFKLWCLCDAHNGYTVLNFRVEMGYLMM